jgi:hypothetical protein
MKLVVTTLTVIAIVLAERTLTSRVEERLQQAFQGELSTVQRSQELRQARIARTRPHTGQESADPCRHRGRRPGPPVSKRQGRTSRPHGRATPRPCLPPRRLPHSLRAQFYRFLDRNGKLIPAAPTDRAGTLSREEESNPCRFLILHGPQRRSRLCEPDHGKTHHSPVSEIITALRSFPSRTVTSSPPWCSVSKQASLVPPVAEGRSPAGSLAGRSCFT